VGAVTAFLCISISTAVMLIDVVPCVVPLLIEDKRCLLPSRVWLLMD